MGHDNDGNLYSSKFATGGLKDERRGIKDRGTEAEKTKIRHVHISNLSGVGSGEQGRDSKGILALLVFKCRWNESEWASQEPY